MVSWKSEHPSPSPTPRVRGGAALGSNRGIPHQGVGQREPRTLRPVRSGGAAERIWQPQGPHSHAGRCAGGAVRPGRGCLSQAKCFLWVRRDRPPVPAAGWTPRAGIPALWRGRDTPSCGRSPPQGWGSLKKGARFKRPTIKSTNQGRVVQLTPHRSAGQAARPGQRGDVSGSLGSPVRKAKGRSRGKAGKIRASGCSPLEGAPSSVQRLALGGWGTARRRVLSLRHKRPHRGRKGWWGGKAETAGPRSLEGVRDTGGSGRKLRAWEPGPGRQGSPPGPYCAAAHRRRPGGSVPRTSRAWPWSTRGC